MKDERLHEHIPRKQGRVLLGTLALAVTLAGGLLANQSNAATPGTNYLAPDALYPSAARLRLTQASQGYSLGVGDSTALFSWGNGIPNALAGYYTYEPLTTADATAVGFPSTCGNLAAGDTASTADCYIITVKRLNHNFELKSILDTYQQVILGNTGFAWPGTTTGLMDPANAGANFSATQVVPGLNWKTDTYGYGSGGKLWRPPYIKPGTALANDPAATITGNAPIFFRDFPIGLLTGSTINGIPGTDNSKQYYGIWHFPAPTIKGTKGRPVMVQWLNDLPNIPIPGFDPTVDCSDNAPSCFPFNRIVTHVHGAHVGPGSDGLAHAGFNPNFSNIGTKFGYAETQNILEQKNNPKVKEAGPKGTYIYPMDQEASTIWYHDHAVGTTHLNTNQGMAGFFPVTDDNEACLRGIRTATNAALCPTLTQQLPTGDFELGFALQERMFDEFGQFYMPDAPVISAHFPSCDQTSPASRANTCEPLFMYEKHALDPATLTPAGIHMVPYNEATIDLSIAENAQAPVLPPSATLEYFGNMPVVNGVVYGSYNVSKDLYRMRFIGGTDSRTWNLKLNTKVAGTTVVTGTIPFHVIGTEQGLLNAPISRDNIILMPGERVDVLVDFSKIPNGSDQVILANYGDDGPFGGATNGAAVVSLSAEIPEIMAFNVSNTTVDNALLTSNYAAINLRAYTDPLPAAGSTAPAFPTLGSGAPNNARVVALEEITDEYGRTMPTIDRRGYDLFGMPATEVIKLNDVEEWDIVNTTVDAHPMHIHQVAFQILGRIPFDTVAFASGQQAVNDIANGVFLPATYTDTNLGVWLPPGDYENGWKDTVFCPPGYVTKVRAKFDIAGEYVWHCHILSHEEHDMMRPMVIASLTANAPTGLTVPNAAAVDRTATVTIVPPAAQAAVPNFKYVIEYADTLQPDPKEWIPVYTTGAALTPTIAFPRDGVFTLRVKSVDAAMTPVAVDSAWVTASNTILVSPPVGTDTITAPSAGSVLTGSTQTFTFGTSGSYPHSMWVGKTLGGTEIGRFKQSGTGAGTITATGIPTDGKAVYVRLITTIVHPVSLEFPYGLTENRFNDYTFTAASSLAPAVMSAAIPSTLTSGTQTFSWSDVGATSYQLHIGTTGYGSTDIGYFPNPATTALSTTVSGLPVNGSNIYVRLYSLISGSWSYNDYVYKAASPAAMLPSVPGTLTGTTQTFAWNNTGATLYQLHIGTSGAGSTEIGFFPNPATTATSVSVSGLPADGSKIYVRLYSQVDGAWIYNDYQYNSYNGKATMLPTVPATFTSGTQTFSWTDTGASLYQLHIGTTGAGSTEIGFFPNPATIATSVAVSGLPTDGSIIYVRLYSLFNGSWQFVDYQYTAFNAKATMLASVPATIAGGSQNFAWTDSGATSYQLHIGTTGQGSADIGYFPNPATNATSATITGLPTSGTVYVRLYSLVNGAWQYVDYSYLATP